MKFVFTTKVSGFATVVALACLAGGCGAERSRTAASAAGGDGGAAQRLVTLVDYISSDYGGRLVKQAKVLLRSS